MNTYSAKAIANAFLRLARKDGQSITPMKLQKLVYLAHGWALGLNDKPLIKDDVEAWQFGPVISSLYHEFKEYGSGAITNDASDFDLDFDTFEIVYEVPVIKEDDTDANELVEAVWNSYKKYSGGQLSNLTHREGTPWKQAYNGNKGQKIDTQLIAEHYKGLIRKRTAT
ncbi:MAG: SocA family protein [Alteromonadaceae bacterium]|nr:SocA family protein [Alteromonadaceae bacterium]